MAEIKKEDQPGSHKVSLSWYPNDWKTSDTFLDIDDPLVRYFYLEIIFLLYLNRGLWEINRSRFQKLMRVTISDEIWSQVEALFVTEEVAGVRYFSHESVNKRIDKRGKTSAQNGESGGRPKGSKKPIDNLIPKPNNNLSKPKKPISTIEDKITKENVSESLVSATTTNSNDSQTLDPFGPRLELADFEARHGTFKPDNRKKALKLWKKISDEETRKAVFFWQTYVDLEHGEFRRPVTFSKFVETKWWDFYVEYKKGPYGQNEL